MAHLSIRKPAVTAVLPHTVPLGMAARVAAN